MDWMVPVGIGLLGFLLHWMGRAKEKGGAFSQVKAFLVENSMNMIYAFLAYASLMLIWYFYGLEFMGLEKGRFTAATFMLGYMSSSVLATWMGKQKITVEVESPKERKE